MDISELHQKFQADLDEIALSLIEACQLRYKKEIPDLSSPLMRWIDFRLRFVDPMPRPVVFSRQALLRNLPRPTRSSLKNFVRLVEEGADINPYQGRGLITHNDTSSLNHTKRTDLLWADWGIWHFHLSTEPTRSDQYFSPRADFLAFCLVGGNVLAVIDILQHPRTEGFSDAEIMRIVYDEWPEYLEDYRIKGILNRNNYSKEEINKLRKAGITTFLTFNENVYMGPGMGYSSAKTSLKVTRTEDRLRNQIDGLATLVQQENSQFQKFALQHGIHKPEFSIRLTNKGVAIHEAVSDVAFTFPYASNPAKCDELEAINEFMFPRWMRKMIESADMGANYV